MKVILIPVLLFLFSVSTLFAQQNEIADDELFLNESGEQLSPKEKALEEHEKAKLAKKEAEKHRLHAIKGPGLSLSQSVALKSQQVEDSELRKLLAKEAYEIHLQTVGSYNDPFIFNALVHAVRLPEKEITSSTLDFAVEKLLANHSYCPTRSNKTSPFFARTAHGAEVEVPWALDIQSSKNELAFTVNGWNQGYFEWWDNETKQLLHKIDAHHGEQVLALALNPTISGVYSAGANQTISYTAKDGKSKTLVENLAFKVTDLAVSGDGGHVAAAGEAVVPVWNTKTMAEAFSLANPYNHTKSSKLAISPAGRFVVVSYEDGSLLFWDMMHYLDDENYQPTKFKYPGIEIIALTFSANGEHLLISTRNQQALLWQVMNEKYVGYDNEKEFPFKSNNYQPIKLNITVNSGFFIPLFVNENQLLIQGLTDEKMGCFTQMKAYADYICEEVGKNLSDEEWLKYIGTDSQKEEVYIRTLKEKRTPLSTCPSCPQRP